MRAWGYGAALICAMATGAAAQVADDPFPTLSVVAENDGYFGSDDNYTSGLRLSYLSGNSPLEAGSRFLARGILGFDAPLEDMRMRRGFAIGQQIYTPDDLTVSGPLPDQQPYAGYLYGEASLLIEQAGRVDQVALQLGVVGPSALGEAVQNGFHAILGREDAQGWDNQIENAPAVTLSYDRQRRILASRYGYGLGWDVIPAFGLSLGTVETSLRGGVTFRLGENLKAGYGPPRVRPALAGSGFFTPEGQRSWYVFAGVEGRAVAHNIFLDGSLFRADDPSVTSRVFVGDFQAGAAVQLLGTQLGFTYVQRSREFKELDGPQTFGAISLSTRF
ncbi:MAG: lipid A deacylase LpxR family protein [Parvularcula sp.]|jgi:hypothetical protein|nr:lipid A deacylase LpxR family protein [Parvularcula sp.]